MPVAPIRESTGLVEATTSTSGSGVLEVEFITPGWGSSGFYSREVVEAAVPLFAPGTHMYFDHPSATEDADRPERSVRDLASVITEAHIDPATGGVRGHVRPVAAYRELLTDETFAMNVGLSIRGSATDIVVGEAEGRRGPIIEGLADIQSVDFVTRAGRGGRVLQVMESARHVHEATADDRRNQLQVAARDANPDTSRTYVWVLDMDAEREVFWYTVDALDGPSHTFEQTYTVADNDGSVSLTGDPLEVSRVTRYVPVNPAGSTTTQESQEDTMPQIEESRLRELEEAAGRVTTLTERATTAERERDEAIRAVAEMRAREAATVHARARVTAANAALAPATVDRIVAEATRSVPLTEAGALDTPALDTAVDTARTAEESYLATLTGVNGAGVVGFGESTGGHATESTRPSTNPWGRKLHDVKGA